LHYGPNCNEDRGTNYGCAPRDDGFHVFALRWESRGPRPFATWYRDGQVFHHSDWEPIPAGPVALVINTALSVFAGAGPAGVDANGVVHAVGWVRVWSSA